VALECGSMALRGFKQWMLVALWLAGFGAVVYIARGSCSVGQIVIIATQAQQCLHDDKHNEEL